MTYAQALAAARDRLQLSQGRFAAIINVGVVRLRRLERGEQVPEAGVGRAWAERLLAYGLPAADVAVLIAAAEKEGKGPADA